MAENPTFLLLPNLLGHQRQIADYLPISVFHSMQTIDGLIAESEKEGRRYLSYFDTKKPALQIPIALYNEHTPDADLDFLLEPILAGERWGLVSDAGLPCVADPGAKLVLHARQKGIEVRAFVGPCSMILALMLSGLPGQKFFFHGYLDRDPAKRKEKIRLLARQSHQEKATQLFMEAPYRNAQTLQLLLEALPEHTLLSLAWDLTLPSQGVITLPVSKWKKSSLPDLEKKPTIFLFCV